MLKGIGCFYVMYCRIDSEIESQETFRVSGREPLKILAMAYDFGEKMKKETGKRYRLLYPDHETPVENEIILLAKDLYLLYISKKDYSYDWNSGKFAAIGLKNDQMVFLDLYSIEKIIRHFFLQNEFVFQIEIIRELKELLIDDKTVIYIYEKYGSRAQVEDYPSVSVEEYMKNRLEHDIRNSILPQEYTIKEYAAMIKTVFNNADKYPNLTEEEEKTIIKVICENGNGASAARAKLFLAHKKHAFNMALRYIRKDRELNEVFSAAVLGLMKAIYYVKSSDNFLWFASWWISFELNHQQSDEFISRALSIPIERLQGLSNEIKAYNEIELKTKRIPYLDDVYEKLTLEGNLNDDTMKNLVFIKEYAWIIRLIDQNSGKFVKALFLDTKN